MVSAVKDSEETTDGGDMPYDAAFFTNSANKAATTSAGAGTYVETPSGLKYAIITEGTGASPKATDVVTVSYAGRLTDMDGTEFDSSYKRGEPTSFPLNQVIAGWTEGLQLMKTGAVYEFYIPSDLAYGERGSGRSVNEFRDDIPFSIGSPAIRPGRGTPARLLLGAQSG